MLLLPLQLIDNYLHFKRNKTISSTSSLEYINQQNTLSRCSSHAASSIISDTILLSMIIDKCQLFDLIKFRRISSQFRALIDRKLNKINYLDVRIEQRSMLNIRQGFNDWQRHPSENSCLSIFYRSDSNRLSISLINSEYCQDDDSRRLLSAISMFRRQISILHIDLPIFGSIVSEMNKQQMKLLLIVLYRSQHIKNYTVKKSIIPIGNIDYYNSNCEDVIFPRLRQLTIRACMHQLDQLSQMTENTKIDHELIFTNRSLDLLCLNIVDDDCKSRQRRVGQIFRHLAHFRLWADTDQLGERFIQQFSNYTVDRYYDNISGVTSNKYRNASKSRRKNNCNLTHNIRKSAKIDVTQCQYEIIAG